MATKQEAIKAISDVHRDHRDWSAAKIRIHLEGHFSEYGILKEDIPQIRTVQKLLRDYRETIAKDPLNDTWDMAYLRKHEIPPEIAVAVLEIQNRLASEHRKPLNIREVQWAVTLYPLIYRIRGGINEHFSYTLHFWAWYYAVNEENCKIRGCEEDTYAIDTNLFIPNRADHEKVLAGKASEERIKEFCPWLLRS